MEVARGLAATQHADGSWTETWAGGQFAPLYPSALQPVWITGHHLEWIAQVPTDLRPPELSVKKAILFVLHSLDKIDSESIWKNSCIYIHGARAAFRLSGKTFQDFSAVSFKEAEIK
jgi:hypothetical protein